MASSFFMVGKIAASRAEAAIVSFAGSPLRRFAASRLNNPHAVAISVATYIHRYGHAGDMGREIIDVHRERRGGAPQALGAYACFIDLFQQFSL